jgi:hypothetical protein
MHAPDGFFFFFGLYVFLSLQLNYKPKDKDGVFLLFFFPALTHSFIDDAQMKSMQRTEGSLLMTNWFTVTYAEEIVKIFQSRQQDKKQQTCFQNK